MNKIKKIWIENKVLIFLGVILLICLITIGVIAIKSFYSSCDDAYCNRKVDDLRSEVPNLIKEKLEENKKIVSSSVTVKNAICYISVTFANDVKMEDAKKAIDVIIPSFNDEELLIYDLDLTIKTENYENDQGFIIKGARNSNGNGNIVWSNYTKESSSEKD